MATVKIKFCPSYMLGRLYMGDAIVAVRTALADRTYTMSESFEVSQTGQNAAEEVFDLTNNPIRQEERERVYGLGRSLSSGDIVDVDGEQWVCLSIGWAKL